MMQNRPPLILLGGTLCDCALWQPVRQQLTVTSRVALLHGARSARAMAEKLLATLPPRFALCGFSLGAIVALHIQALAPARVSGLALISVNPYADAPENAATRREAVREAGSVGLSDFITRHLWSRYVARHRQDNHRLHQLITGMAERCGLAMFADQTEIAIQRDDLRHTLKHHPVPLLILNGDEDPICTPAHHAAVLAAAPHAVAVTLSHCGHFVPLEAVDESAQALNRWLEEIHHAQ